MKQTNKQTEEINESELITTLRLLKPDDTANRLIKGMALLTVLFSLISILFFIKAYANVGVILGDDMEAVFVIIFIAGMFTALMILFLFIAVMIDRENQSDYSYQIKNITDIYLKYEAKRHE